MVWCCAWVGWAEGMVGRRMEECSSLDALSAFFSSGEGWGYGVLEQLFDTAVNAGKWTTFADWLRVQALARSRDRLHRDAQFRILLNCGTRCA